MKYKPFPPGLLEIQIHHTTAYNLCTVNTHYFQIYYINLLIFYDNFLLSLKSEFPASGFPPGGFSAISHYSPSVCSAAGDERFFTIQSLKQGGFTHTLHRPGLKDWSYASLIRYSRKVPSINRQRIHLWKNAARKRNNPHRLHLLRHDEEKETKNLRLHILRLQKLRNHTEKRKNRPIHQRSPNRIRLPHPAAPPGRNDKKEK